MTLLGRVQIVEAAASPNTDLDGRSLIFKRDALTALKSGDAAMGEAYQCEAYLAKQAIREAYHRTSAPA